MGVSRQVNTNFSRLTFQIPCLNTLIIFGIIDDIMEIGYWSLPMFMLDGVTGGTSVTGVKRIKRS